jgi:hypothetical protein
MLWITSPCALILSNIGQHSLDKRHRLPSAKDAVWVGTRVGNAVGREVDENGLTATRYRARAEEIGVIAWTMTQEKTRVSLLDLADEYLVMARSREDAAKMRLRLRVIRNSN